MDLISETPDDLDFYQDRLIRWILFESPYPVLTLKALFRLQEIEELPERVKHERSATHCLYGHEWSIGNTYYRAGSRQCRLCERKIS